MSLKWLPNAVTIMRCVLAILVGFVILNMHTRLEAGQAAGLWLFIPFALFTFTAATDWLDGVLARGLDAESAFGARLDPIADKLLTASSLLALAHTEGWSLFLALPTLAIVGRDVLLTAMREALGNPSGMKVSNAAKWKTAIALAAIGCVLFGFAICELTHYAERYAPLWVLTRSVLLAGLAGIWLAAIMSIMTAIDYVAAAAKA